MKRIFILILFCIGINAYPESAGPDVSVSIIYIIHGDGNYVYHDTSGNMHLSDEEILAQALYVGEHIKNGEVFIFHQKKASKFLFFPKDDADFYYFRNGERIREDTYRRDNSDFDFRKELKLYKVSGDRELKNPVKILLYYGHEIPFPGREVNTYNNTHPDITFNDTLFTTIVKNFAAGKKFDLVVVSTCNNGTPEMVFLLSPYSKFIIASPGDLHLSQINSSYLGNLNDADYTPYTFTKNFAGYAFNQLKKNTLTAITISLYDTEKTEAYVMDLMNNENYKTNVGLNTPGNCDCSSISTFNVKNIAEGVTVFYNPPAFGKNKNAAAHSGWGCKNISNF